MAESRIRALLTGASRGIGKSITHKLLENSASVIGTRCHSSFPESFVNNDNFESLRVNLNEPIQVEKIINPVFNRSDTPNVLINNAGIFEDASFENDDHSWLETWDKTQQVNLRAPALLSKWAINRWQKEGGGIIINMASRAAYRGDTQAYAGYAAAKAGLVAFTKSVARDFGNQDIVAYSVAPGFVKTDMALDSIDVYGEEYLTKDSAFDDIIPPEEVADLVTFLATGKVKHMTGATFHINGGSYMI